MRMEDYPNNQEIVEIIKVMKELEKSKDWKSLMFANHVLQAILIKREQWAKENNIFGK